MTRHRLLFASTAALAGAGAFAYHDEGTHRAILFWSRVGPVYLHYKLTDWRTHGAPEDVRHVAFERLHDRYAPLAEHITLRLRGFFIKLAQIASTRDDFVPPQYLTFFKSVQSNVPPEFTPEQAKKVVEQSLGRPLASVFREFDDQPVGCATIGQVHRAVLNTGQEVAVKVQAADAEHGFRSDLGLVINFCRLAMPQHVAPLREFEKQFNSEFDYRLEAKLLAEIADNVMPYWGHKVVIPRPFLNLCTKNVLVMDFLRGKTLINGMRDRFRAIAAQEGKTLEQFEEEQRNKPVPSDLRMRYYTFVIKTKDLANNLVRWLYNVTIGPLAGYINYVHSPIPLNIAAIINLIINVHAHQLFIDGAYNADPHPGNILLLPDGRLGLIDYGQVGRLSVEQRIKYSKFILALAVGKKDKVVKVMTKDLGFQTQRNDPEILWKAAVFHHDKDWETEGINPLQYMDWLDHQDPVREVPSELVMVGRLNLMMRGFANAFKLRISLAQYYRPYAEAVLQNRNILRKDPRHPIRVRR